MKNKQLAMNYNAKRIKKTKHRKLYWTAGLILVLLLVGGLWAHFHHQTKAVSGTIPASSPNNQSISSKGQTAVPSTSDKSPSPTTSSTTPGTGGGAGAAAAASLTSAPSGTFVSNHSPNLSGSPAPSEEQSTCNTLPGATCYIEFTKNGVVKKLDPLVADGSGGVTWNWDVKQAGFTTGNWTITAVATLNGQTKTTTDSRPLEVQP